MCIGQYCNNQQQQQQQQQQQSRLGKDQNTRQYHTAQQSEQIKQANTIVNHKQYSLDKSILDELKPHEFRVLLDTGSTNILLLSSECINKICEKHQTYDVNWQQEQWKNTPQTKIGYISGNTIGKIIYDDVNLGTVDIDSQPIFVAKDVKLDVMKNSQWDGVVGLGYWYNKNDVPDDQASIIDNLISSDKLDKKTFNYYIPNPQEAKASFGEHIEVMKPILDGNEDQLIRWVGVKDIDKISQWQVYVYGIKLEQSQAGKSVMFRRFTRLSITTSKTKRAIQDKVRFQQALLRFNNRKHKTRRLKKNINNTNGSNNNDGSNNIVEQCQKQGCKMLLDTGTYFNYVPQKWFKQFFYHELFKLNKFMCNQKKYFPDIVITLKDINDEEFQLRLSGSQYLDEIDLKPGYCSNSFIPDDIEKDLVTLGQVFLKNYYTIFDFGMEPKRIGFYALNGQ